MAETSSLLNCRRGNSTASSNLVLSAFEQPTATAVGCFVVVVHRACSRASPQQSNQMIAQQSVVQRQRPRGSVQDGRSQSCRTRCSRTSLSNPNSSISRTNLSNPNSSISRTPLLIPTIKSHALTSWASTGLQRLDITGAFGHQVTVTCVLTDLFTELLVISRCSIASWNYGTVL